MAVTSWAPMDTTFGAIFIALVISAIFYGVTVVQIYLYYRQYAKDTLLTKVLVLALWILDTLHLIFCTIAIYWYLVANFGNYDTLDKCTWSMNIQADFNGLIALMVDFYFARRVYLLSQNWIITSLIVVLVCLHFSLGIVFTVEAFAVLNFSLYPRLTWIMSTGLGCAAAADILIAASMCYYLAKRRTGFKRTNSVITTLMIFSINTGLLTSIIATASAITFATMPTNFVWQSFFWVLGRCYVNSLLATLNTREYIFEKGRREPTIGFLEMSHLQFRRTDDSLSSPAKGDFFPKPSNVVPLAVTVETITERTTDYALDSPTDPEMASCSTLMPRPKSFTPVPAAGSSSA